MSFCGSCGSQLSSESIRFCPECGSPTQAPLTANADPGDAPAPYPGYASAPPPMAGAPEAVEPVGDPGVAPPAGSAQGTRRGRRWLIPVAAVVAGAVIVAGSAFAAVRLLGGSDDTPGTWMWQQPLDSSSANFGLAIKDGVEFASGPTVGVGYSLAFQSADDRVVAMPEFAGGFASLIRRSTDGEGLITLSVVSEDEGSTVVSEWSGDVVWLRQVGTSSVYALIDADQKSLFFSVENGDIETCYRVDAEQLRPVQVASGNTCRWEGERAVVVTQSEESAPPRFTVFDRTGEQLAEGTFPAGTYPSSDVQWSTSDGWAWANRSILSDSSGEAESYVLEIMDLATGTPVQTVAGYEVSVLDFAADGRGLVVAADAHEERWDVSLIGPDGSIAGTVAAPQQASALVSADGTEAWVAAKHGEASTTVHYLTPGADPKQVFDGDFVRLLQVVGDRVLATTQGATTADFRVLSIDRGGEQAEAVSSSSQDSDYTAAWQVSSNEIGGRVFILGPDGAAGSIWSMDGGADGGSASKVVSGVDLPEEGSDSVMPVVMAGSGGELVLLYSQSGQNKVDLLGPGGNTPLAQGPHIELLGVEDGQAWYNTLDEGTPTDTYRVPLDGKDLPTQVNLVLGATAGAARSEWLSGVAAWESSPAWVDPVKVDCKDSGLPVLDSGESYDSAAEDIYVCAELEAGDRVVVTPFSEDANYYIITTDSVGSDSVEGTTWTAPRDGFYKINTWWSCWLCTGSDRVTTIAIKGSGGA